MSPRRGNKRASLACPSTPRNHQLDEPGQALPIHAQETCLLGVVDNMSPWHGKARQGSIKDISRDWLNASTPRRHVSFAWQITCLLGVPKHTKEASRGPALTGLVQPRPGDMFPRHGSIHVSLAWQGTPKRHISLKE